MLKNILTRLREPSTLAGLSCLAMMFGVSAGTADVVTQAVTAVLAAGAVLIPEAKGE
jgi:hypothetical protein